MYITYKCVFIIYISYNFICIYNNYYLAYIYNIIYLYLFIIFKIIIAQKGRGEK